MRATVREALAQAGEPVPPEAVAERLALGAMLGARGNSGVIVSQLFRALDEVAREGGAAAALTAAGLAGVFCRTRELAYAAVSNPVEGTILSVLSALAAAAAPADGAGGEAPGGGAGGETARAADEAVGARGGTAGELLERLLGVAEQAVAATPEQLPILREAGVVDAGGYGLLVMLRGWYEALCGKEPPAIDGELLGLARAREEAASGTAHPAGLLPSSERGYGYCVTLLVEAPNAAPAAVRQQLAELGDSVLVVAVDRRLKLHVHVPDPAPVVRLASNLGTISRSEVSNIDEQTGTSPAAGLSVVAAVSGEGLAGVFRSLGARVIAGGQTQNPSTAEFLDAARGLSGTVFLLPNNGNAVAAAQQAAGTEANLLVVPTASVPQGIAAALAYDPQAGPETNLERMRRAASQVRTAEIVTAARAASLQGIEIAAGQDMVMLDGELLGVEDRGLAALLARLSELRPELATIYYGLEASREAADQLRERFLAAMAELEVEVVRGDQPHAKFTIGFE
jgi:DAK2 domain fusion protein YloV